MPLITLAFNMRTNYFSRKRTLSNSNSSRKKAKTIKVRKVVKPTKQIVLETNSVY